VLVLTRKSEQSLHLGDDILVTVLSIEGDRVKLGIDAPRTVSVLRHELYEQVRAANTAAASTHPSLQSIAHAIRTSKPMNSGIASASASANDESQS
jgi:carbon storage regulator